MQTRTLSYQTLSPPNLSPPTVSPPPASPVILHEDPNLGKVELEKMEMEELDIPLPANTEESILMGGGLAPHYIKYTCFFVGYVW